MSDGGSNSEQPVPDEIIVGGGRSAQEISQIQADAQTRIDERNGPIHIPASGGDPLIPPGPIEPVRPQGITRRGLGSTVATAAVVGTLGLGAVAAATQPGGSYNRANDVDTSKPALPIRKADNPVVKVFKWILGGKPEPQSTTNPDSTTAITTSVPANPPKSGA